MSEHQKQTAFFKSVVQASDSRSHRELRERILKAEHDERCVRRGIAKICLLIAVSIIGGLYTVVMMPEILVEANHSLRKVFQVLALGSLLTLGTYVGLWFYYRAVLFQVHSECRRFLMNLIGGDATTHPAPREDSYPVASLMTSSMNG